MRACTGQYLDLLAGLITSSQCYIPMLLCPVALCTAKRTDIQNILTHHFTPLSTKFEDDLYERYVSRLKRLLALADQLAPFPRLQEEVAFCINGHDILPTSRAISTSFNNMTFLQQQVLRLKGYTEETFYQMLDDCPDQASVKLKCIITKVRSRAGQRPAT